MPREEPRDLVEGLVGLVQFPEVELEDVRAFRGHLQGHVNVVPGGVSGQPDGVVTVVCFRDSGVMRKDSAIGILEVGDSLPRSVIRPRLEERAHCRRSVRPGPTSSHPIVPVATATSGRWS